MDTNIYFHETTRIPGKSRLKALGFYWSSKLAFSPFFIVSHLARLLFSLTHVSRLRVEVYEYVIACTLLVAVQAVKPRRHSNRKFKKKTCFFAPRWIFTLNRRPVFCQFVPFGKRFFFFTSSINICDTSTALSTLIFKTYTFSYIHERLWVCPVDGICSLVIIHRALNFHKHSLSDCHQSFVC